MRTNENTVTKAIQMVADKYHTSEDNVRDEIAAVLHSSLHHCSPVPSAEEFIVDVASFLTLSRKF